MPATSEPWFGSLRHKREAHLAGDDLWQHLALHVLRAVQREVHAGVDHRDAVGLGDTAVVIAERLAEHGQIHIAAAHSTILGRIDEPHVSGVGQRLVRLEGIFSGLVELADLVGGSTRLSRPSTLARIWRCSSLKPNVKCASLMPSSGP